MSMSTDRDTHTDTYDELQDNSTLHTCISTYSFCPLYAIFFLQLAVSVTDNDEQTDRRHDNGRRDPESEVAPEGEVVAEELGSPGLLADDQIRGRA
jgi:hypothetical protein